ncbi:hypothetical protein [Hymenobacter weizhouensis]|uniref:hypothetical protein n=1 Tax=Hymenobacter sp. YIM 151500-1 TaxID=2987689 RepID=UPI0022262A75|nr:hypothetical protein [Hymenobacter sp. YIM 151500-1]UYZ63735.1 hypothetical protein OIS53_02570 [Hymenobacter sp. YIM 151500-1]
MPHRHAQLTARCHGPLIGPGDLPFCNKYKGFWWTVPAQYAGRALYVYGIDIGGDSSTNALLDGSGKIIH